MTRKAEQPEQKDNEARQQVEAQIGQKYRRLKWYQRSVGAACLLLGFVGGYLDNKQIAAGESNVSVTLIDLPLVAAGSIFTGVKRRRTRTECDQLIEGYAKSKNLTPKLKSYRTDIVMDSDRPVVKWSFSTAAHQGDVYDKSYAKAIRFASYFRDAFSYIGGVGLNGFSGDFNVPPEFTGHIGPLGVASVGTAAIFQMIEEASIGAHLRGYEAQLNNIDSFVNFRLPPPAPQA